jgi:hypothetical protein
VAQTLTRGVLNSSPRRSICAAVIVAIKFPPRDVKRHRIPASSFIPHPRRALIIGDLQFL